MYGKESSKKSRKKESADYYYFFLGAGKCRYECKNEHQISGLSSQMILQFNCNVLLGPRRQEITFQFEIVSKVYGFITDCPIYKLANLVFLVIVA